MYIVAYGGGLNSTAMLIGMIYNEPEVKISHITFADTGGERPETYAYVDYFDAYLKKMGKCGITRVHRVDRDGERRDLEQDCLAGSMLPSIAYGFKACSMKYKRQPQDKYFNNLDECKAEWAAGRKITKLIGYDADEERRATIEEDKKYTYRYPLIDWGWSREDCLEAVQDEGLCIPPKSACFFCPSSSKAEVRALAETHPELMLRALAMENKAQDNLTQVKGLGRSYRWADLLATPDMFADEYENVVEIACGCYDG